MTFETCELSVRVHTVHGFEQPFARLGLFNLDFFARGNVCYFNRADEKQVFPSIGFKEDGSLDVENTVYYNKFL